MPLNATYLACSRCWATAGATATAAAGGGRNCGLRVRTLEGLHVPRPVRARERGHLRRLQGDSAALRGTGDGRGDHLPRGHATTRTAGRSSRRSGAVAATAVALGPAFNCSHALHLPGECLRSRRAQGGRSRSGTATRRKEEGSTSAKTTPVISIEEEKQPRARSNRRRRPRKSRRGRRSWKRRRRRRRRKGSSMLKQKSEEREMEVKRSSLISRRSALSVRWKQSGK